MPLLSMNELTTYRWTFDEDLLHYARAGFDGVGVWLRKLSDFGEEKGLELLSESGLIVSNVVWAGGFTGSDGVRPEENLAATRRALALASEMRAGSLVLHTGGRNSHTQRHAERLFLSALDRLIPLAEAARVPLAIEPMHPACAQEWTLLTTLEDALSLVKQYDTPWLRLVYDTYHFPLAEPRWDLLRAMAPYTAIVHLGDYLTPHSCDQDRCPLGEGEAPLIGLIDTFTQAGYDGFFDVELMGLSIETLDYQRLLDHSMRFFQTAHTATLTA